MTRKYPETYRPRRKGEGDPGVFDPDPEPPRPSSGLIQLAGSDHKNQCITIIARVQCGKLRRPGSHFCSPKCQGMYNRAHPDKKLT